MAPKKPKPSEDKVPQWILTYGDLMSLLLCFFILLAAFSEIKKPREYQMIIESIKEAFGFRGGMGSADSVIGINNTNNPSFDELSPQMQKAFEMVKQNESNVTGRHETVSKVHEGVRFAVGGSMTFPPGSFELTASVKELLTNQVAPRIRGKNYKVAIRGHAWGTDDMKSGLDLYELSYRRARAVFDYLVQECDVREEILMVVAVGKAEPVDLTPNSVEADGPNRRVEVYQTEVTIDELHPDPWGTGRQVHITPR